MAPRRRRWATITPTSDECNVFAGTSLASYYIHSYSGNADNGVAYKCVVMAWHTNVLDYCFVTGYEIHNQK